MNYREFLGFILGPAVLAVALALTVRIARGGYHDYPLWTAVNCVVVLLPVAVLFTTPWDGWLIAHAVWGYPPGSVLGALFGVPFEEYLFMIGLTAMTGCWTIFVALRSPSPRRGGMPRGPRSTRLVAATAWLGVVALGTVAVVTDRRAMYLGSLLAWFGIPLSLQAYYGADVLRRAVRLRLTGLALTPLLWVADAVAIHAGAWYLSDTRTVGVTVAGLAIEEMLFFLLVNLLVVDSIVLVTHLGRAGLAAALPGPRRPRRSAAHELDLREAA